MQRAQNPWEQQVAEWAQAGPRPRREDRAAEKNWPSQEKGKPSQYTVLLRISARTNI